LLLGLRFGYPHMGNLRMGKHRPRDRRIVGLFFALVLPAGKKIEGQDFGFVVCFVAQLIFSLMSPMAHMFFVRCEGFGLFRCTHAHRF
jgi:hypothetical protein